MVRDTSIEAYHDAGDDGTLNKSRRRTYEYLLLNGPCTGGELNEALKGAEGNPSYHRRARELVETGFAVELDQRPCRITGRAAYPYKALDVPIPLEDVVKRVSRPVMATMLIAVAELTRAKTILEDQGYGFSESFEKMHRWLQFMVKEKS